MTTRRPISHTETVTLLAPRADGLLLVDAAGFPPAAALAAGEEPAAAARRLQDQYGLRAARCHLAATDHVTTADGSARHHLVWREIPPAAPGAPATGHHTVAVGRLLGRLPNSTAARLREGCRAGLLGETVVRLHDGRRPGASPAKVERTQARFTWHPSPGAAPHWYAVHQVWGWLTDPAGAVLILLDLEGRPSLPGGRPEKGESCEDTLAREAAEEAAARHGRPRLLGIQHVEEVGQEPYAQLRMTAALQEFGPALPDPDSGQTYRRVLVPAAMANLLLGWGPEGDTQAAAVAASFPSPHGRALRHVPERGWEPEGARAEEGQ